MDVFLGSSNTLRDQRLAFSELANSLADPAFDTCGQDVIARLWETESYAMERNRSKQAAYDEVIRECDLVFILVGDTLGDYTLHEYLVAAEACARKGYPRVTVWVSPAASDENTHTLLSHAALAPDVEMHTLTSINTMLLEMVQLMASKLGPLPLRIDDEGVWTGHKRLVSLEGVPAQPQDAFAAWLAHR